MARISFQLYGSAKAKMRSFDREVSIVAATWDVHIVLSTNKMLCSNVCSNLECGNHGAPGMPFISSKILTIIDPLSS
jgi:hypothetical protein